LNKATGISGLYHVALDSLWNLIDTYLISDSGTVDPKTNSPINAKPTNYDETLSKAKRLLETAGDVFGNKDALYVLADMYFVSEFTTKSDRMNQKNTSLNLSLPLSLSSTKSIPNHEI
jgi:hypothetical protein